MKRRKSHFVHNVRTVRTSQGANTYGSTQTLPRPCRRPPWLAISGELWGRWNTRMSSLLPVAGPSMHIGLCFPAEASTSRRCSVSGAFMFLPWTTTPRKVLPGPGTIFRFVPSRQIPAYDVDRDERPLTGTRNVSVPHGAAQPLLILSRISYFFSSKRDAPKRIKIVHQSSQSTRTLVIGAAGHH